MSLLKNDREGAAPQARTNLPLAHVSSPAELAPKGRRGEWLTCVTLNVRGGIQSPTSPKSLELIDWLRVTNTGVLLLQETFHVTSWAAPNWTSHFSPGTSHQGGVAVLIHSIVYNRLAVDPDQTRTTVLDPGRAIQVDLRTTNGRTRASFVSVYAPADTNERAHWRVPWPAARNEHFTLIGGDANEEFGSVHDAIEDAGYSRLAVRTEDGPPPTHVSSHGANRALDWFWLGGHRHATSDDPLYGAPCASDHLALLANITHTNFNKGQTQHKLPLGDEDWRAECVREAVLNTDSTLPPHPRLSLFKQNYIESLENRYKFFEQEFAEGLKHRSENVRQSTNTKEAYDHLGDHSTFGVYVDKSKEERQKLYHDWHTVSKRLMRHLRPRRRTAGLPWYKYKAEDGSEHEGPAKSVFRERFRRVWRGRRITPRAAKRLCKRADMRQGTFPEWVPWTADDVRLAFKQSKQHTAPGPDGLTTTHWRSAASLDQVAEWVAASWTETDQTGISPKDHNIATTATLWKGKKTPDDAGDYRPISLTPIDYRCWARSCARRMAPTMRDALGDNQEGFLPNRHTSANVWWWRAAMQLAEADMDEDSHLSVTHLDFAGAFDTLPGDGKTSGTSHRYAANHGQRSFGLHHRMGDKNTLPRRQTHRRHLGHQGGTAGMPVGAPSIYPWHPPLPTATRHSRFKTLRCGCAGLRRRRCRSAHPFANTSCFSRHTKLGTRNRHANRSAQVDHVAPPPGTHTRPDSHGTGS